SARRRAPCDAKQKGGLYGRPFRHVGAISLHREDGDDPEAIVDDDDLLTDDEVLIAAPLGVHLHDHLRDRHDVHGSWDGGPDREREVDVVHARSIAATDHRLADLGALLLGEIDGGIAATLLGVVAWLGALLALLTLVGLTLLTLVGLTLLTLALTGG